MKGEGVEGGEKEKRVRSEKERRMRRELKRMKRKGGVRLGRLETGW